jgi:hypothetical protein
MRSRGADRERFSPGAATTIGDARGKATPRRPRRRLLAATRRHVADVTAVGDQRAALAHTPGARATPGRRHTIDRSRTAAKRPLRDRSEHFPD